MGENEGGAIIASYSTGNATTKNGNAGGLVGLDEGGDDNCELLHGRRNNNRNWHRRRSGGGERRRRHDYEELL